MAVDLNKVTIAVSKDLSNPGDKNMFLSYKTDLSQPGEVMFPFWFAGVANPTSVIWGAVKMDRDTAVYLCKEQVWAMAQAVVGKDIAQYVPADVQSGNWDCNTASIALVAYQAMLGGGIGNDVKAVPLDGKFFSYLLSNSPRMQLMGDMIAKTDPQALALLKGGAAGRLVVPPPMPEWGSQFVQVNAPAGCTGPVATGAPPGTQPGTTPPGTGYLPVVAQEGKKTSWWLPALLIGGAAVGITAVVVSAKKKQAGPSAAPGEFMEEPCECRY